MCTENGFDLASDGEVPTVKPAAIFHSALADTLQKEGLWLPRNTAHNLKNAAVYFLPLPKHPAYTYRFTFWQAESVSFQSVPVASPSTTFSAVQMSQQCSSGLGAKADSEPLKPNINASPK